MLFPLKTQVNFDEIGPIKLSELIKQNNIIEEKSISSLLGNLSDIIVKEPNCLYLPSPIIVCGNINGQIFDLFRLFAKAGDDFSVSEPAKLNNNYLFLGDYTSISNQSINTLVFLFLMKIRYPTQIFLLRGHLETRHSNKYDGFYNECIDTYGSQLIWNFFNDIFDMLPYCAVIDQQIFCVHSGLSPKVNYIGQISSLYRRKEPECGAFSDFLWSEPENVSKFVHNKKGKGFLFGQNQTLCFAYNNRLIKRGDNLVGDKNSRHGFIVRSHQIPCNDCYWLHNKCLANIWSAPNYLNRFDNKGEFLRISQNQSPEFVEFEKDGKSSQRRYEVNYFD